MSIWKKLLIGFTFLVYIIHLIFNGLAAKGKPGNKLFPNSPGGISKLFNIEITPVGATFSIWGFIFFYQVAWLIYSISTIFRDGPATNILSQKFYYFFLLNIFMITTWLFLWARTNLIGSLIVIFLGQVFVNMAIGFSCKELYEYTKENGEQAKPDIWCIRLLVQNGLLFYGTWTTIATLLNLAIVLRYEGHLSSSTASIISLSLLGVLVIFWFILENFIISKFTEYTFTVYIVLTAALSGILANIYRELDVVAGIVIGLLILSIVFLFGRLLIIVIRFRKKKYHLNTDMSTLKGDQDMN